MILQHGSLWTERMSRAQRHGLGRHKACTKSRRNWEFLEYTERQTKTRTGAEPRNVTPVKPMDFPTNSRCERDPVAVKRPNSTNLIKSDSPFYLGINHTKDPSSNKNGFINQMFKFNSLMKTMAQKAGQRLWYFPPTHNMQVSGLSVQQQKTMSRY